ncbi:AaceriAGR204Wp [[Ashbya] aceris (nom. inval.)]|nr:AaceriAGR204Wp [[Ashbya] aceris (nom. inval.)]
MKTVLIGLKLKDTEPLDWSKALASYLKRNYGQQQWSQFYDAKKSAELDQLRVSANSDLGLEALLEQNLRYYGFLEQLYLRLGSQCVQLKLDYTWYDAEHGMNGGQKYKQHTLVFEKSSTLFNIGVLLSQLAGEQLRASYKDAIPQLARAVACFEYMSETFLNSPSVDLQAENTGFLAALLHAEAQELFLLNVINSGDATKRASLLCRLAYTCARFYRKCVEFYKEDTTEGPAAVPYGETKWRDVVHMKMHLYEGVAAYNSALALEQAGKIGHAVGLLEKAAASMVTANTHRKALQGTAYCREEADLDGITSVINEKLKTTTKDNDYIYHDHVPSDISLDSTKLMDAIKVPEFDALVGPYLEAATETCNDLFRGIVPMAVYERESLYTEEKAQLLRREVDAVEQADWEYQSFVDFTNLPKLLDDLERRFLDPNSSTEDADVVHMREQLQSWADAVRQSSFNDIEQQSKNILQTRNDIMALLSSVPPENKEDVVKIKSSLLQASQSDEKLFSQVKPYINEIQLLNNPTLLWSNFNAFMPSQPAPDLLDLDDSKTDEVLAKIRQIRQMYENLKLLKEERTTIMKDLKDLVNQDDITKQLILNNNKSDSQIKTLFHEELEKFRPLGSRIEATVFKQSNTIKDIKIGLDTIFKLADVQEKTSAQKHAASQRKEFFTKLQKAATAFRLFETDLPKGLSFYDLLYKMTKEMHDLSVTKRTADSTLSANMAGLSISPNKAPERHAPPPLTGPPLAPRPYMPQPQAYRGNPDLRHTNTYGYNPNAETLDQKPRLPQKIPTGISGLEAQKDLNQSEEDRIRNPTNFYNTPSVFNESMYSKFSQ